MLKDDLVNKIDASAQIGAVTIPQTVVNISFSVVMNAVAGPERRYELNYLEFCRRLTAAGNIV